MGILEAIVVILSLLPLSPLAPSGVALETSIEGNQDGTSAPGGDKRPGERRKSSTIERTEVSSISSFILALMHVPSNYGYPL